MAKPYGFAIEFNSLGTPPSPLYAQWRSPRWCGRWGGGCRALRVDWGGVEVVVCHTVPPLDGLLCCVRCPHHCGPRLCCGVERAGRALVRWCRLLCARSPCCAASVPGRRRPAHICAQITAPKTSWPPRSPTRTADECPTHHQTVRPISAPAARRGKASPVQRPTTSQSHRGVVVWAKNQHACAKTRGSFVDRVPCQGNKHRLTGKTSEAVFVSFVWVN